MSQINVMEELYNKTNIYKFRYFNSNNNDYEKLKEESITLKKTLNN